MKHYTDEDVARASRAIARKNMPNASEKLIDHVCELGEWDDAARWVLDAVAPAIAARALRGFATGLMNALAADVREDPAPPLPTQARRDAFVDVARMARHNADEIEPL